MGKCLSKQAGAKGEDPDKEPYAPSKKESPPESRAEVESGVPEDTSPIKSEDAPTSEKADEAPTSEEAPVKTAIDEEPSQNEAPASQDPPAAEEAAPVPPKPAQDDKLDSTDIEKAPVLTSVGASDLSTSKTSESTVVSKSSWSSQSRTTTSSSSSYSSKVVSGAPLQTSDVKMEFINSPSSTPGSTNDGSTKVFSSGMTKSSVSRTVRVQSGNEEPSVTKEEKATISKFAKSSDQPEVSGTLTTERQEVTSPGEKSDVHESIIMTGDMVATEEAQKEIEKKRESVTGLQSSMISNTSSPPMSPVSSNTSDPISLTSQNGSTVSKTKVSSMTSSSRISNDVASTVTESVLSERTVSKGSGVSASTVSQKKVIRTTQNL